MLCLFPRLFFIHVPYAYVPYAYVPQTAVYPLPFTLCPLRCARVKRAETGLALPNAKPTESRESLAPIRSLLLRRRSWQRARCRRLCQRALSGPSIAIARGSRRWRPMIVSSGTIMTGESPNRTKKTLLSASFPVPNRIQPNVPTTTSSLPGSSSPCWGSA